MRHTIATGLSIACVTLGCGSAGNASNVDDAGQPDAAAADASDDGGDASNVSTSCVYGPAMFFVATNGNDQWSGKLSSPNSDGTDGPFASLSKGAGAAAAIANGTASDAVVVQVRGGTYSLAAPITLSASDSGSATRRVIIESYPEESPVFSGGVAITGWQNIGAISNGGPTAWRATVPSSVAPFEQLWVNGQRRYRPTTTVGSYLYNGGDVCGASDLSGVGNCVAIATADRRCPDGQYICYDRFQFMGQDILPTWYGLAAGDIEIDDFEDWTMSRMRLTAVDATSHVATLTGSTLQSSYQGFLPGHRYLVENVKEALTQPGQWYWDRPAGTLTYLPVSGEDMSTASVTAPQIEQLLVATNLTNTTFCGLTFSHSNWTTPAGGYTSADYGWGAPKGATSDAPAAVTFLSSSSIDIDACTFAHLGASAISLSSTTAAPSGCATPAPLPSTNDVIENSLITDVGLHGIVLQGYSPCDKPSSVTQLATIQNNLVTGGGRFLPEGIGILVGDAHDVTVTHNEVYDFYSIGIDVGDGQTANTGIIGHDVVSFNYLHDLKKGVTSDGGAIHYYVGPQQPDNGNAILNNWIHDITYDPGHTTDCTAQCTLGGPPCSSCYRGYGANGVYLDGTSQYVTVKYNLVYHVMGSDLSINPGAVGHVAQYNVFALARTAPITRIDDTAGDLTFENNIVYWDENVGAATLVGAPFTGAWDCQNTAVPGSCTSQFVLHSNLYWYVPGQPTFVTGVVGSGSQQQFAGLSAWQTATTEDLGSVVADPKFSSPATGNFAFDCASAPVSATGFDCAGFQAAQAGLKAGAPTYPPPVPDAFPVQLPSDPATYY